MSLVETEEHSTPILPDAAQETQTQREQHPIIERGHNDGNDNDNEKKEEEDLEDSGSGDSEDEDGGDDRGHGSVCTNETATAQSPSVAVCIYPKSSRKSVATIETGGERAECAKGDGGKGCSAE